MTIFATGKERLASREWANEAVRRLEADANRSADTHLHTFPLPTEWGIDLYLKDESVHPTGSLKHRLARSLFLYGICNGWIHEHTTVVEASSGSTAVSEAYFARFLGLPFIAVMPETTSLEKIALIEAQGGSCHLVADPSTIGAVAERLAAECGGHFLDQFTYAERATDWRGNNNIAESIFNQMALERHPVPAWVVNGAGTGGTSATIGRFARLMQHPTQLCVVDPDDSIFYASWSGDLTAFSGRPSRIEGIGRQRVEPSFLPDIVDRMIQVPDGASIATMRHVRAAHRAQRRRLHRHERLGRVPAHRGDARPRRAGQRRHADLRRRRPLRRHVLQRRVGGGAGPGARPVRRGARDLPRDRRVPAGLDLGDHPADLVHDLGRDLVHPVRLARV